MFCVIFGYYRDLKQGHGIRKTYGANWLCMYNGISLRPLNQSQLPKANCTKYPFFVNDEKLENCCSFLFLLCILFFVDIVIYCINTQNIAPVAKYCPFISQPSRDVRKPKTGRRIQSMNRTSLQKNCYFSKFWEDCWGPWYEFKDQRSRERFVTVPDFIIWYFCE